MKVNGMEYMEIGSVVKVQKPYFQGVIIARVHRYSERGYPILKVIYAEKEDGGPQLNLIGKYIVVPALECELFTGDVEQVEARVAFHML